MCSAHDWLSPAWPVYMGAGVTEGAAGVYAAGVSAPGVSVTGASATEVSATEATVAPTLGLLELVAMAGLTRHHLGSPRQWEPRQVWTLMEAASLSYQSMIEAPLLYPSSETPEAIQGGGSWSYKNGPRCMPYNRMPLPLLEMAVEPITLTIK